MITAFRLVSLLGLALTLIPSILFAIDSLSLENVKTSMTIGMLLWLVSAPVVQGLKQKLPDASH
ncbi:hypothetical protein IEN85_19130 [Pelagicoccus sp. NFK12]|uniref:Uncharacterized protein n=1 Tax=Pelagicoccus enzymogenes TaxID=2773457 RepID=A0A927FDY3_9BACT|nr:MULTISPECIES: hypothetical protein [Pelagicoccus]MBD5781623.1 hypothetical protein [Pelagicoccus enzymogenes]MDQ8181144.1 hypothetical protein [Pelagicoccus sp. SDUM812005]